LQKYKIVNGVVDVEGITKISKEKGADKDIEDDTCLFF
jgi:hypothetical protein